MKLTNLILPEKKKYIVIFFVFIGLVTVLIGFGMINLQLDSDVSVMLPDNAETAMEREKIDRLGKEFPSEQSLFVSISDDPFSMKNIENLWKLCSDIEKVDAVKSTLNPFNSIYFSKIGDSFTISRMNIHTYPKTQEDLDKFMEKITSNRFLVGSVISFDHKHAGILVRMNPKAMMGKDVDENNVFIKLIENVFGRSFGKSRIDRLYFCTQVDKVIGKYKNVLTIDIAGVPVYEAKGKEYMSKDMIVLLIPALFLMTLVIFLNFRTARGTILPLMTICLGLVWTMGIIGWMRYKLTVVGVIIPPIIITLGSSYSLYFLQSYYSLASQFPVPRQLVKESTKQIWQFVFLAGTTTILGFVSCLTSVTVPIFYFGLFVIISTILIMFFTFFMVPNTLQLMPVPKTHKVDKIRNDLFSKILESFRKAVIPLRYLWISLFFLSIVLFAIFIPNLRVETDATKYFKDSDNLRKGIVMIQKNIHGTYFYNITLRSVIHQKNYFKTREGLLSAKKVQDYFDRNVMIDGHTMLGAVISPVSLVEDLNNNLTGKTDIPEDEETIKRFLSFLKASNDDGIKSLINSDFSAINFQVRLFSDNEKNDFILTDNESTKLIKKLTEDLDRIAKDDGGFTVELWGEVLLLSNISKYLLRDQSWNLTLAVILVFVLMLVIFRSVYFSIIGLIPMVFAIIMNFTIMPIFNIPLDVATVLISSISIGVGIHNSIYFILFYRKNIREGKDLKTSILDTLEYTSRPIFFTSLALVIGFMVFLLSSYKPIIYFGLLIAIAMVTCTFATLFIMPAIFAVTDRFRLFSLGLLNKILGRKGA
jgi:uncharacterized protein